MTYAESVEAEHGRPLSDGSGRASDRRPSGGRHTADLRSPGPAADCRPSEGGWPAADRRLRAADRRLLAAARECGGSRGIAAAARTLSYAGEHGALWLAAGLLGAAGDRERRGPWLRATAVVGGAHLLSMGVKRAVRRARPGPTMGQADTASPLGGSPGRVLRPPLVHTPGRYSFPSSHATSAAAAAVAFGALLPTAHRLLPPIAAAVCVSRLVVGVHYPTDIAAGAALGGLAARVGHRWVLRPLAVGGEGSG